MGVDVSDRCLCLSVHIPGNLLAGNWRAAMLVDDRCTPEQQRSLLDVFTGRLGGPIADLAGLIGEVVAVERVSIAFDVVDGRGRIEIGDVAEARMSAVTGRDGSEHVAARRAFSTIPRSPAFVGKADRFRRDGSRHGLPDVALRGHNAVQGSFRFSRLTCRRPATRASRTGRDPAVAVWVVAGACWALAPALVLADAPVPATTAWSRSGRRGALRLRPSRPSPPGW